ncbi:MAG: RelA/SpoT family protein [Patescibacteria group bacterium]|nr:RelA/SpoT family protein [Patescibacteria group bacterium]MCL5257672.1 RelA/SpoT family protein [Patescibacteria group bacterium]
MTAKIDGKINSNQFQELIGAIKKYCQLNETELELIKKAFTFSQEAHRGQKRKSGEPYFNHAFQTALKISQWQLDLATAAAALLHDVVEDTDISLERIKKEFGDEIAFLVDGVTKISRIKYRGNQAQIETLKKMILAMSEDIRVVFIKLADRLHNLKTLNALAPNKQKRIALETNEIYSPLAYRLGMSNLAGELDDLAFPYLHPTESKWLKENVKEKFQERERYLENVKKIIGTELEKNKIKPIRIDTRAKRYASLYKKILRYDMDLSQVYDLVAVRIIVQTVEECYAVLGFIHKLWPPLPGRIKDYIALPKPNGYRSIHTTVICEENKPTEFQIRTLEMHEENENGIAAYWFYSQAKQSKNYLKAKTIFADRKELNWIEQLKNWQNKFDSQDDFLQSLKIDFFKDRIFTITPKGEVFDLPAGSTPIDFAYAVHTEIGNHCVGARVNDKIVNLDQILQSGDIVEILTQKTRRPSESWIRFIKTDRAKKKIRNKLRQDDPFKRERLAEIKILAEDKINLIKNISDIIAQTKTNIKEIHSNPNGHFAQIKIKINFDNKEKTEKILIKLKNIKVIKEISYRLI